MRVLYYIYYIACTYVLCSTQCGIKKKSGFSDLLKSCCATRAPPLSLVLWRLRRRIIYNLYMYTTLCQPPPHTFPGSLIGSLAAATAAAGPAGGGGFLGISFQTVTRPARNVLLMYSTWMRAFLYAYSRNPYYNTFYQNSLVAHPIGLSDSTKGDISTDDRSA